MTRTDETPPRAEVVAEEASAPRAEDHHALEADVDDAGPLGPEAAETGQGDRHREADRRDEQARRVDVVGAGDDSEHREDEDGPEGHPDPLERRQA